MKCVLFLGTPTTAKKYEIKKCSSGEWAKFRRYHYLNGDLPNAAICYGVYDNENIIAFMGVLHQPHDKNKKIKRVCRLVVLPDYQGIGIATKFLKTIAEHYTKQGYDFSIVTSAKNLIHALNKSNDWLLQRYSATKSSTNKSSLDFKRKSLRTQCKTSSFFYKTT